MSQSRHLHRHSPAEVALHLLSTASRPLNIADLVDLLPAGNYRLRPRFGAALVQLYKAGNVERIKRPSAKLKKRVYHYTITAQGRERLLNAPRHPALSNPIRLTPAAGEREARSEPTAAPLPAADAAFYRPQRVLVGWRKQRVWTGRAGGGWEIRKYPIYRDILPLATPPPPPPVARAYKRRAKEVTP